MDNDDKITGLKEYDRYGFVCDCGCAVFQLCTPNEIICDDCGFTLPDMVWIITSNGEKVDKPVIKLHIEGEGDD